MADQLLDDRYMRLVEDLGGSETGGDEIAQMFFDVSGDLEKLGSPEQHFLKIPPERIEAALAIAIAVLREVRAIDLEKLCKYVELCEISIAISFLSGTYMVAAKDFHGDA